MKNTALVTGASSGIGLALSAELARRGYPLLMVSNEDAPLAKAAMEIEAKYGIKAIPLFMDLAQRDSAQKLFNYCQINNLKIEILVNNAGIFFFKDITGTPPERMELMINLHCYTPALLCHFFAKQMTEENRKGYILNMASIASRMMMPGITLYSATKSFIRCFSRSIRHELFSRGVSVTTISPGAVATGFYSLAPRYLKLGVRLGIIITPERMALLAVRKMFKRKAEFIPGGLLNRLFIILVIALPEALIRRLKRKIDYKFQKSG